ncbi:CYTH domain-containing protein [Roseomonas sp. CECT 9278]|uniref:CYTH domain-containing protein n=1 Tax=Roseomonas sp. CECT 9278 TaxID=2845823 RepID=UPI001E4DD0CD|nr:CYTH domain-containing protein [Roseomonas sp. CECT 9278]CAH0196222.1 Inorganic triphosphatase [Roseomonas sp. CECT 9278]
MGIEIERRFLVAGDDWRGQALGRQRLVQGYLAREDGVVVRVRLADAGARLTIKGPGGLSRAEYEYEIPRDDAQTMLETLCRGRALAKTRHTVPHGALRWEVDVFEGVLAGLVIAEVELPAPDHPVALPPWVGAEITGDGRYANAALVSASAPPEG